MATARTVSVELTAEQVTQMLSDGQYLYPEKTNEELGEIVDDAATYGPGVYVLAMRWYREREMAEWKVLKEQRIAAFHLLFPAKSVPLSPSASESPSESPSESL